MAVLNRADLLEAIAKKSETESAEVECPELGGAVLVRGMTGTVRNRFEAAGLAIQEGADGALMDKVVIALISACVVDGDGRPFITRDMAEALFKNHPSAAFRIRDAAVKMSGFSEEDAEELAESFE